MNKLKRDKQIAAISALVEGNSIRSVERLTGIHRDTIRRLMLWLRGHLPGVDKPGPAILGKGTARPA